MPLLLLFQIAHNQWSRTFFYTTIRIEESLKSKVNSNVSDMFQLSLAPPLLNFWWV
jgi:hypothetical protein